jgi:hypothetical protein
MAPAGQAPGAAIEATEIKEGGMDLERLSMMS